jgi:GWxTD domain-containing protein
MRAIGSLAVTMWLTACGALQLGSRATPTPRPQQPNPARTVVAPALDAQEFYRRLGLLAHGLPLPFAGSIGFLASAHDDSTQTLVALSLAASALTFRSEGDEYRADYRVVLTLKRGESVVTRIDAPEVVRVATLKETHRVDESVLFQQLVTLAPGAYTLDIVIRDETSAITSSQDALIRVPTLGEGALAAPIAVYDPVPRAARDSVPRLVISPRATATVGRDSVIPMYIESYGSTEVPAPVSVSLRVDGVSVWNDTVTMKPGAGLAFGTVQIPVSRVGLGVASVVAWRPGQPDSVRTPVFVGLGDDLPITTYDDMLSYLRYFVSADRLTQLKAIPPADRGAAWIKFLRETDSVSATPENEALQDYFVRLRRANDRFAENGTAGWRTDRGMVLLLLGDPDQVLDQTSNNVSQAARTQLWEYRTLGLTVEFVQTNANQWRLTAASESQVMAAVRRRNST